ncbi:MAG TPA: DNA repair exonuclease, partial [Dehalococcoidia bacterium]|nr:DNA repair exonuclease [Dehalococcoidia bacterium]
TGLVFHEQMLRLEEAGIPVFITLGNHDAASVITKKLSLPDNVHIFPSRKAQTQQLSAVDVAIHGRSFSSRDVTEDLSATYPAPVVGAFNIGLLHTAVDGREGHDLYAPCSVPDLVAKGYDYWALGHVHQREHLHDSPPIVFPGNLQGRHIRETSPDGKGCTIVDVDQAGRITTTHHAVDVVRWEHVHTDVANAADEAALYRAIDSAMTDAYERADGRVLAARITLSGSTALHGRLIGDPDQLLNEIRARGADIGGGRIWIEKVVLQTQPAADPEFLRQRQDTLGDVVRALDDLSASPQARDGLQEDLAALFGSLTPDVYDRSPELARLRAGESLDDLLEQASQLIVSALAAGDVAQ